MTKRDKGARQALNRLATRGTDNHLQVVSDAESRGVSGKARRCPGSTPPRCASYSSGPSFVPTKLVSPRPKAGTAASRSASTGAMPVDIAEARRLLRAVLTMPNAPEALTLAARKESELSDADVAGMIDDLRELGLPIPGFRAQVIASWRSRQPSAFSRNSVLPNRRKSISTPSPSM